MTKEDILDYVMNTPNNTNRMVLSNMLDELQVSSGSNCLIVEETTIDGVVTLNKTAGEIIDALPLVFIKYSANAGDEYLWISGYYMSPDSQYRFDDGNTAYIAESLESHPVLNESGGGSDIE